MLAHSTRIQTIRRVYTNRLFYAYVHKTIFYIQFTKQNNLQEMKKKTTQHSTSNKQIFMQSFLYLVCIDYISGYFIGLIK